MLFFYKQRILENLFPWDSLFWFKSEHAFNQNLKVFVFEFLCEFNLFFIYFINKLFQTWGFMRCSSIKHLEEDDSHWPNITFSGITATVKNLRTHVHWTSNKRLVDLIKLRSLLIELRESKISNFINLILDKNVSWLKIPMNDRMLMKILVSIDKLFHNHYCLIFWKFLSLL